MKYIKKLTKKTILAIMAILVIGLPLLYLTVLNQKEVSAAWFNESWLYRAAIPISAHTAEENNVYITVTIDTATPITASKMQSDCGDLRFTKENGELLPYFINASPGCNNASTTVQVQFKNFPAGAQTVYYYYGNPSAPNGFNSAAFSTAATGATIGSVGSETQGPGPIAYWSFDDGQGSVAQDSSSFKNTATLGVGTSAPAWQPEDRCIAGKCLYFDGTDDKVTVSNNVKGVKSVSFWVKPKTNGEAMIDFDGGYHYIMATNGTISAPGFTGSGNGADGACTVSSDTNINSASCAGRGTADAVNFSVTANTASGQNQVTVSTTPTGLAVGDEILIINLMGTSSDNGNVGQYETQTIASISTNTLTLDDNLTNTYDGTTQKIMVQRVPNYSTVTVNSTKTMSASVWDGSKGGVLFFRANGAIIVNGTISMSNTGYNYGQTYKGSLINGGGGGGGGGSDSSGSGGAGGSGGTASGGGTAGSGGGNGTQNSPYSGGNGGSGGAGATYGAGANGVINSCGGGGGGGGGSGNNGGSGGAGGGGGGAGVGAGAQGRSGGAGGGAGGVSGNGGTGGNCGTSGNGGGGGGGGYGTDGGGGYGGSGYSTGSNGSSGSAGAGGNGGGPGLDGGGGGGGAGGATYGSANLSTLFLGSPGANQTSNSPGGIILVYGDTVSVNATTGSIVSNGANASSKTGGSSGGSIKIYANTLILNTAKVTASGGTSAGTAGTGGAGGDGRIALYSDIISGTTSPSANTYSYATGNLPTIYVNGKISSTFTANTWQHIEITTTTSFDASAVAIGNGSSSYLNGFVDDVKIYPYVRTKAQILADFNSRSSQIGSSVQIGPQNQWISSGLVGYWKMDESSGNAAVDYSGNSYTMSGVNVVGNGADGAVTFSSDTNINTANTISGRSCADGGDAVNYSVSSLTSTTAVLSATPSSGCLTANDEVLLINLQGTSANYTNVGNYETLIVSSISTNTITFTTAKTKYYGDGASDDTNIGTATTNQRVMLQRVPNYTNVTVNSTKTLNASAWDGAKGGVLFFRATGTVTNSGTISTAGLGYRAGSTYTGSTGGYQGEGYRNVGANTNSTARKSANAEGGGAPWDSGYNYGLAEGGGGGGYGVAGSNGTYSSASYPGQGSGGSTYGSASLPTFFFGSAGGAGSSGYNGTWGQGNGTTDGKGGNGGGIIFISAAIVSNTGTISATGSTGNNGWGYTTSCGLQSICGGGGGSGAGGSILIQGTTLTLGSSLVTSSGGSSTSGGGGSYGGGWNASTGGAGGAGRIALVSSNITGTTSPTATASDLPSQVYPTYTTGKFGNATSYDGSTQYISTASTISGIQTVSFWTNPAAATNYYINLINSSAYITTSSDGTVSATGFSSPSIYVNGVLNGKVTASSWNHVVVTSGTGINANAFNIGMTNDGSNHYLTSTSKMDEVRVYNRVLSPKEISDLYNWAPGPVGYWDFEEGTGSSANDLSTNANTGTITNAAWSTGKYGKGLKFDGSGDYVTRADDADFDFAAADNFTVQAFAKHNGTIATNPDYILTKGDTTNGGYQLYMDSSGNFCFGVDDDGNPWGPDDSACSTGTNYSNDGKWHHVAGVKTGTTKIELFVDGVLAGSDASIGATGTLANGGALFIGIDYDGSSNSWDGWIDEPKIYNYARSQKQIVSDMNAGHPAVGSPVGSAVAHWDFDEGQGTTANNSGSGGSTLNGTLASSPSKPSWSNSGKYNKGISFDGQNDYVSVDDNTMFDVTNVTISAWVNATSLGNYNVILIKRAAYGLSITSAGDLYFSTTTAGGNDGTGNSSTKFTTGVWHHVVGTYDGTTMKTYLDGKLVETKTRSSGGDLSNSAFKVFMGYSDGDGNDSPDQYPLNGVMDEAKIYNYALTADEVKLDYNHGASLNLGALGNLSTLSNQASGQEYCVPGDSTSCTAPVGRWDFEEGLGSTVYDSSGNGYSGSITGATYNTGKHGKGLKFNGGTDAVDTISSISGIKTVAFWVNPSTTTENLIDLQTSPTAYNISISGGTVTATNFDSPTIYVNGLVNGSITANIWNHVEITTGTAITGSTVRFGRIGTTSLTGKLDSIRFFDYARSAAQVAWDYNKGAPVGYWDFDECQGDTAHDLSENRNDGTITVGAAPSLGTCNTASTAWGNGATGKRNASLSFDGTDDYTSRADDADFDFAATDNFTVSAWVKHDGAISTASDHILAKADGTTGGYKLYMDDSGDLCFVTDDDSSWDTDDSACTSGVDFDDSSWHHVVGMKTGTTKIELYVDGRLRASDSSIADTNTLANSGALYIGVDSNGSSTPWDGQIDEVKIYNYALTTTQIKDVYNNGAVNFGPGTGSP